MNRVQDGGLAALAPANPIGRKTRQRAITRVLRKLETSLTIPVNRLYFGDNLGWLRNTKEFPDASVDPVYLDPPFNSNAE